MSTDRALAGDGPAPGAFTFEPLEPPTRAQLARIQGGAGLALSEAERIHEEARRAGEAEGREAGLLAAHAEVDSAIAAFARATTEVHRLRAEIVERLERDAVEMALALAEQIVAGAIDVAPERVLDGVRGALRRVSDRHRVTILVNPADLELVSGRIDDVRAELGGIDHCDVQADRRVARGGTVVSTAEGEIDAQVETQFARAREIVAEQLTTFPTP